MIKISKGKPIPPATKKYPFGEMEIGDSIYVPNTNSCLFKNAYTYGSRHGKTFIIRNEKSGVRCWRIS